MGHHLVLELHRRYPLAPGLDHVLGAIGDLDEGLLVDRGDVPGAKPTVVEALGAGGILEIGGRDPRSTHLELARLLPVPGHLLTVLAHQPGLHPRQGLALLGAHTPVGIVVPAGLLGVRAGGDRARLGHPPGLETLTP